MTKDLRRRVHEHKTDTVPGFTSKHRVYSLVWYEQTDSIVSAVQREKPLKNWHRNSKISLIEQTNPYWHDLYPALLS